MSDEATPIEKRQAVSEAEAVLSSYLRKRGVKNNLLISKDIILAPPFSFEVTHDPKLDFLELHLKGAGKSPTDQTHEVTSFHRVESSKYRGNSLRLTSYLVQNRPFHRTIAPLQPARWNLLNLIPLGGQLSKEEYFRLADQSDARRRWTELKLEYGFDVDIVDTQYVRGTTLPPVNWPDPRPDMKRLKDDYWDFLSEKHSSQCNVCTVEVVKNKNDEGTTGVIDHRIPVVYGGSDDIDNLQLLCTPCNNKKNQLYQNDPSKYLRSYLQWAYPEKYRSRSYHLMLEEEDSILLNELVAREQLSPSEMILRIIREKLRK